ncbi:copper resistance D family protein [Hahella ganghwensis]|uniref:copper resistance D family protein n=1 Tax=Hahella ganghwensis TaxID=286420 RepID=UPI00035E4E0E|nr:CopD family protein [Hahella ganghwensis]
MMSLTTWEFWTVFSRWVLYLSMAGAIGGAFNLHHLRRYGLLRQKLLHYTLGAALIGILATTVHFFVRVGAVLESGIAGMFDKDIASMMWESALGDALLIRTIGLLLLLLALLLRALVRGHAGEDFELRIFEWLIALGGVVMMAFSFTQTGHAVEQPFLFQLALAIHILLTFWWMGSLYPLWLLCHHLPINDAFQELDLFGRRAVFAVLTLLGCGLFLSYELTQWQSLTTSEYGEYLLIKLALVAAILVLAAIHKLKLVPRILHRQSTDFLRNSILTEKIIGGGILAMTTILSTLVGPAH